MMESLQDMISSFSQNLPDFFTNRTPQTVHFTVNIWWQPGATIVPGKLINHLMKFFWKIFTWNKDLFVMHTVFLDIQSLYSLIGWICVSMYFSAKNTFCLFFFLIVHKIQILKFWLILVLLAKYDIWDRIYIILSVIAPVFFSIGF